MATGSHLAIEISVFSFLLCFLGVGSTLPQLSFSKILVHQAYSKCEIVGRSSTGDFSSHCNRKMEAFRDAVRGNHLALNSLQEDRSYDEGDVAQWKDGSSDCRELVKDQPLNDGIEGFGNHPSRSAMPPSPTLSVYPAAYIDRSLFSFHIPLPRLAIPWTSSSVAHAPVPAPALGLQSHFALAASPPAPPLQQDSANISPTPQHSHTNVLPTNAMTPTPQHSDVNVPISSAITTKVSPPPPPPYTESSPTATPSPPGSSSKVEAVTTAVVVTAAVTLALAGIIFYFYQKFRPSVRLEEIIRPKDDKPLLDNSSQSGSGWSFAEKSKGNYLDAVSHSDSSTLAVYNTADRIATSEKKGSTFGIMQINGSGTRAAKGSDYIATNGDSGTRMDAVTNYNKYRANSLPTSLAAEVVNVSVLNSISKKTMVPTLSVPSSSDTAGMPSSVSTSLLPPVGSIPSSVTVCPAHSSIPVPSSPPSSPPLPLHVHTMLSKPSSASQAVTQPSRPPALPSRSSKLLSWPPLLPGRGPFVAPPPRPPSPPEISLTNSTSKLPPWPPLPTSRGPPAAPPPPTPLPPETASTSTSKLPPWPPLPTARGPPVPPPPPVVKGTVPRPPVPPPGARGPPPPPPPPATIKGSAFVPGIKGSDTTLSGAKGAPYPDLPPLRPSLPPKLPSNTGKLNANKATDAKPKLKPLHWDKVKADPSHSMVWDKLRTGSFELNEEIIETLFGYNANATSKDAGKPAKPSVSIKKPTILDPKKAQNIAIQLRALNLRKEDVCDALLEGDGLSCELLEVLVKMAPTQEEQKRLQAFNGNPSELGPADRFLKALLEVPFAFERLKSMLFKACFKDDVMHAQECLQTLEVACTDVRNSRLFLKLLEAVLKTGNRMNAGTFRGEADAFKLDALLRLSDIKSADGKMTLLHFVVEEIIKAEGVRAVRMRGTNASSEAEKSEMDYKSIGLQVVLNLSSELGSVRKAAGIDADGLNQAVSKLVSGLGYIKEMFQIQFESKTVSAESLAAEDNFLQHMFLFVKQAEKDVNDIQTELSRVMDKVKQVTAYFHGNLRETQPLRLFMIVSDFLRMLERVCTEVARTSKLSLTADKKL